MRRLSDLKTRARLGPVGHGAPFPSTERRRRLCFLAGAVCLAQAAGATEAGPSYFDLSGSAERRILLVGHDALIPLDTPIKRYSGTVASIGEREGDGRIYAFQTTNTDYVPGQLKSWRLTFISGELLGSSFQVLNNTASDILVTEQNGPLNGLTAGDTFLVEEVLVRQVPSRR